MGPWVLGERRNIYTVISAAIGDEPVIIDANYEVFDIATETIVASGGAIVSDQIIYFLWEPTYASTYVARINYEVDTEDYTSNQVVEVKETM